VINRNNRKSDKPGGFALNPGALGSGKAAHLKGTVASHPLGKFLVHLQNVPK
jgi:hypothetical protein